MTADRTERFVVRSSPAWAERKSATEWRVLDTLWLFRVVGTYGTPEEARARAAELNRGTG